MSKATRLVIRSKRKTPRIDVIYVVVTEQEGREGVVRRDTPVGTIPMTTDDAEVAEYLLDIAREQFPTDRSLKIVAFTRATL